MAKTTEKNTFQVDERDLLRLPTRKKWVASSRTRKGILVTLLIQVLRGIIRRSSSIVAFDQRFEIPFDGAAEDLRVTAETKTHSNSVAETNDGCIEAEADESFNFSIYLPFFFLSFFVLQ